MSMIRISGSQFAAGRVLVGLSRQELAERADLCRHSIRKMRDLERYIPAAHHSFSALTDEFAFRRISRIDVRDCPFS